MTLVLIVSKLIMEVNLCLLESRVSYQSTDSSRAHFLQVFGDGGMILHKIVEGSGIPS